MSDLISRSCAIENIWDVFNSYANDSQRFDEYETEAINNAFKVLQKTIESQPTAYDVSKVVAELEEEKETHTEHYNISLYKDFPEVKQRYEQIQLVIDDAIDKVRKGGVK